MDSSSSSSSSLPFPAPLQEKYDVFLSFRGEDTRATFTSHLHKALLGKNIDTYIDRRLERGDEIAPALLKAIERSKIALVIFSKDYASSTWCLKELVHILGCKKSYGQIVVPIFYRIDPSDVRKQQGTYALEDRPRNRSRDEVANWRAALEEAANISGFHDSSKTGTEADFVEEVVQDVWIKLNRESSSDLRGLFGIQRKIEKIESLLCLDSPGVCCVGIWGMGGIGKTTLADAVFHRQWQSSKFEACCFLANVREKSEKTDGLHQLRNKLVGEILKDKNVNIDTPSIPPHIQDRLRRTKALIVLDDVNARKQLEYLVGHDDRFCQGSRIIITARDKGLLEQKVDPEKIYNVEGLGSDEALELFHSHAFENKSPTTDYTELSREVVDYIKGIPLALKVMGSSFRRCKSKQEWEDQWKKVKEFPDEEINQVLRISYDGLGKHEKEIFLDIACFHKGDERNYVKEVLDGSGFYGKKGINDLIDRSLISISYFYDEARIEMHDLVEEMGKAIAQEQGRLFMAKDVNQLLANNQSDGHVQAISIDWREMEYANFEKMHQLRWLRVGNSVATPLIVSLGLPNSLRYLRWDEYPLKSLPSKFSPQNLVVLEMLYSSVGGQLWNEDQSPKHLKRIDLKYCMHLTKVPNLSRSLQIEHIDLNGCGMLVEIPSYFQHLGKLTYLDLGRCTNLKNLPEMPCNLEFLDLSSTAIEELPSLVWSQEKISRLDISYCKNLKSLPSNTCKLKLLNSFSPVNLKWIDLSYSKHLTEVPNLSRSLKIEHIDMNGCQSLVEIPSYFRHLGKLTYLDLGQCTNLKNLPEMPCNLEFLDLSWTAIEELPSSVWSHEKISRLDITYCGHLKSLPSNTCKLKLSLSVEGCESLCEFWELPRDTTELALSRSTIKELRNASIESAVGLTAIKLYYCKSLVSLATNIWKLKSLKSLDLENCSNFQNFPEISEVMEYLEFLNLSYTAVKELPTSIRNLVALRELDLQYCKNLEVVPDELFCLTSLQELNLMGTKIKSIPASIKQAAQLSRLFLSHCKSLQSLPELPPSLKEIDLSGCSKCQYFPEILEPMKHLEFLNLSDIAVKELPPSIGNLVALRELDLRFCKNLEVVPDELFCLTSLQVLNLSGTKIKSLPASIKQAAQLSRLFLNSCKSLESLPELPPSLKKIDLSWCYKFQYFPEILEPMEHLEFLYLEETAVKELPPSIGNLVALRELYLSHCNNLESLPELPPLLQHLEAEGCTSLKTVSSSSTALAQGWEKYKFSQGLHEKHIFSNCRRLDENARSNIMGDAQLKIMRMATAWSKFEEDKIEEALYKESSVGIISCGNEIPKWFSHKSEGCSIKVELPRDWFSTDFLGFALSLVVAVTTDDMDFECKYNFKTSTGESHEVKRPFSMHSEHVFARESFPCDEVFVWYLCGAQRPTAFYKLVTEVNVDFTVMDYYDEEEAMKVEKCGICLLYGKDAEMIKQRAL